jgi:hypothetical protein
MTTYTQILRFNRLYRAVKFPSCTRPERQVLSGLDRRRLLSTARIIPKRLVTLHWLTKITGSALLTGQILLFSHRFQFIIYLLSHLPKSKTALSSIWTSVPCHAAQVPLIPDHCTTRNNRQVFIGDTEHGSH